jgi:HEAT repeat protein
MMESLRRNDRVLNRLATEALAAAGRDVVHTLMIEALASDNIWHGVTQRKNASVESRQTTATAFGNIDPVALPALTELLADDDSQVRWRVAWALGEMGPAAETAIPALMKSLRDKDGLVRCYAASALAKIGPAALPILTELLKNEVRQKAETDVPFRTQLLGYTGIREDVALALGRIGQDAKPAIPTLTELLSDKEVSVRQAAALAIRNIGPVATAATPALTKSLTDENEAVRTLAAFALGRIGLDAAPAIPTLTELLNDKEGSVRQAAAWALGEISFSVHEDQNTAEAMGKDPGRPWQASRKRKNATGVGFDVP